MARRKDYDANWKVWFPTFTLEGRGNAKGMITQTFRKLPPEVRKEILKHLTAFEAEANSENKPA